MTAAGPRNPLCCSSLATTGDGTRSAALARRGVRRWHLSTPWPDRTGRSKPGPVGRAAGSDTIAAAFRAATKDERIKAIVFRVNSPGGSYVASDTIWREVCKAREAGKPVVASMGDLAASGGYFVSMAADVIVAEPATLTGSIGVFGRQAARRPACSSASGERRDARRRGVTRSCSRPRRASARTVGPPQRVARLRLRRFHVQGRPRSGHEP